MVDMGSYVFLLRRVLHVAEFFEDLSIYCGKNVHALLSSVDI